MELLLFTANCVGNQGNCFYPQRTVISNAEELKDAVKWDHVCAEYKGDRRSIANFMNSVVAVMDCDNDHSDKEEDWFDPEKMEAQIPDVAYAVTYSRHNWKQKGKKTPRPRFHVYFRIRPCSNAEEYKELKEKIYQLFPLFDDAALDAARFIYGADTEEVIWHDGLKTIDEYVKEMKVKTKKESEDVIPQGSRNNTLSRFAAKVLTRYGNCDRAHEIFMGKAAKCEPPMEESELSSIWKSATKFFEKKVKNQEGYVSPEDYDADFGTESLMPEDYSDIGQAKVLTREYGSELCYTPATDYLRFNGDYWVESKQQAVGAMEEFLDLQLADAKEQVMKADKKIKKLGVSVAMQDTKSQKLIDAMDEEQVQALEEKEEAVLYLRFVMRRRDMKYITSALQAAKPMLCLMLAICIAGCGNAKQESAEEPVQTNAESSMKEAVDASAESEDAIIMKLYINDTEIPVIWEENDSVREIMEEVAKCDIIVAISMYSDNEQVGSLGRSYTSNNKQTTTHNGDIVLYNSSNIVVFYGSNSWSYTRLGKMDLSENEVTTLLSNGDVELKLTR